MGVNETYCRFLSWAGWEVVGKSCICRRLYILLSHATSFQPRSRSDAEIGKGNQFSPIPKRNDSAVLNHRVRRRKTGRRGEGDGVNHTSKDRVHREGSGGRCRSTIRGIVGMIRKNEAIVASPWEARLKVKHTTQISHTHHGNSFREMNYIRHWW